MPVACDKAIQLKRGTIGDDQYTSRPVVSKVVDAHATVQCIVCGADKRW